MSTRSHLTQVLQNYADINEVRVRQCPYSLDAQLFNAVGRQLESHQIRYQREVAGRFLSTCPRNLDNHGVYFEMQLPNDLPLQTDTQGNTLPPSQVVGTLGGQDIVLSPLDDLLPIPSSVVPDSSRSSVTCASLTLGTLTLLTPQCFPGRLPIPDVVSFLISDLGTEPVFLTILVEGQVSPRQYWGKQAQSISETITATAEGVFRTTQVWESIAKISVFGLPDGASVTAAVLGAVPCVPDEDRPFMQWDDRSTIYPRYWQVNPRFVQEIFRAQMISPLTDQAAIQSQRNEPGVVAVAVEPFTAGAFAVSDITSGAPTLHYFDRREPMPTRLSVSVLRKEPNYGLIAELDTDPTQPRRAVLQLQPYANAGSEVGHRYSIQLPNGSWWLYVPVNGIWSLQPLSNTVWMSGPPADDVPFLLAEPGEYVFQLETRDAVGNVLVDATPFLDRRFSPAASWPLDLMDAQGVGFDAHGQLWIWDGAYLHPYVAQYQAYAFDSSTRTLYLTQQFDQVTVHA